MAGIARYIVARINEGAPGIRGLALFLVLAAEVLGLSIYFDPWLLQKNNPHWSSWFVAHSPALLRIGVAFAGGLLVVLGPRLGGLYRAFCRTRHRAWPVWLLAHFLGLILFVFLTARLLGVSDDVPLLSRAWLVSWVIASIVTTVFWMLALAPPRFWRQFIRTEYAALGVAGFAAAAAWAGGLLAQKLWRPLAEVTFRLTHLLLDLVYPSITSDPVEGTLGTAVIQVQIDPACSGYEGMALVTVFIAVYIWLFRKELRFPQALLLFPLGILVIYIANVIRLAALILLGTHLSPAVAVSGFHSQAGWIAFTVIAVGVIVVARRVRFFSRSYSRAKPASQAQLATALLAPLFFMMAAAMITSAFSTGFNVFYPLQVLATTAAIWHFRRAYRGLGRQWSWQSIAIGSVVSGVWIILAPASDDSLSQVGIGLAEWPTWASVIWICFRVIGLVAIVPVAEELAFRGYLIRKLIAKDFENVSPGQFTWFSFLLSSVLFGLLHGRWAAGTAAGMLFAFALFRRGQLADAVVAHTTANALVAVYVLMYGKWSLWS